MTSKSCEVIDKNMKYLQKVIQIDLGCKREYKIDDKIGDDGFAAIFHNAAYLSNLELLNILSNKI